MAAVYEPQAIAQISSENLRRIVDVNLMGTCLVTCAVLPCLRAQRRGQLALCGSLAGYRGLPNGQPYSATKAAVQNFAETLRLEETPHGLDIRLISPGFVETPMTAKNTFAMPMMISPQEAAASIIKGLNGRAFEVHFPKRFTTIMKILRCLPHALYFRLAENFKT
jgi:short-subunit dehydrogenase